MTLVVAVEGPVVPPALRSEEGTGAEVTAASVVQGGSEPPAVGTLRVVVVLGAGGRSPVAGRRGGRVGVGEVGVRPKGDERKPVVGPVRQQVIVVTGTEVEPNREGCR